MLSCLDAIFRNSRLDAVAVEKLPAQLSTRGLCSQALRRAPEASDLWWKADSRGLFQLHHETTMLSNLGAASVLSSGLKSHDAQTDQQMNNSCQRNRLEQWRTLVAPRSKWYPLCI